jgi:stearoyl-CoA desaturase (Delta-9 desaturase)
VRSELSNRLVAVVYFLLLILLPFLAFCFGVYQMLTSGVDWLSFFSLFFMYFITLSGITVGFHRYLTHRSFDAKPIIKFLILAFGSMAFQGPAISWVSVHLKHHEFSDQSDDPHGPLMSFLHGHFTWILKMQRSELNAIRKKYGRKLFQDEMVVFFDRTFLLWSILGLVIPFLIAGWNGLLWGGLIRIFLVTNVTWCVNSICHLFGSKDFQSPDNSKNNFIIGILAFGEGWHNNHHAFPRSAFHGFKWWQFDLSGGIIRFLSWFGLVWNIYEVSEDHKRNRCFEGE